MILLVKGGEGMSFSRRDESSSPNFLEPAPV
jgi:hypothetical protein